MLAYERSLNGKEETRALLANSWSEVYLVTCDFHDPYWEVVRRLELCGFKVMALVCDGLAANRKLLNHLQRVLCIRCQIHMQLMVAVSSS